MKRALALLMMGCLVLAGCLHEGTVEQITDEQAFALSATEEWSNTTVYADTDFRCDDNSTTSILFVNDGDDDCADGSDENPNGVRANFTCADGSAIPFNQTNDRSSDCADGSDEVATTKIYTITGEIGSEQKDNPSLYDVQLLDKSAQLGWSLALAKQDNQSLDTVDWPYIITFNDNDNDGLLSSGDTYRIESTTDSAELNMVFYDVVAGVEVVSVREAMALRGVCNCIVAPTGWHLDPDPATNICTTCTSSSDCSAAGCVMLKDSNPLITMAQGCYWSTVYSV
ncbi:MAG: hypothetical protein QF831_02585, partial [Candidatus Thalassarchaeaceae archaeon]|nr:hypothetical protein [Candidatus Thalassarchaeaceae archaeon]